MPAKWVLPEAVDPPSTKCFVIEVPDDPQHIAAFRGALLNLASAYKWADDPTHMAKDVALRWREAIEDMAECDMAIMLRTNPFDSCGAQVSYDGGVVWTEFFNARDCAVTTVRDTLGNETPPGGDDPDPFQCFQLDLVVQANSMKVLPLAVASGWTLSITYISGAWWDGDVTHYWQCPTGYQYALGTCTANSINGQATDPIPTGAKHMQLIILLPDGTYDDIPLDGSDYIVPQGQPAGNYFLLCNDGGLSDNQGSVSLHIEACNTDAQELDIPASGTVVYSTGNSQSGATYRMTFTTTWIVGLAPWGNIIGDAYWREGTAQGVFDANDIYVTVDGNTPTPYPTFVASHIYVTEWTGTGSPFAFQCYDTYYGDNSGQIHVRIERLP